MVLDAKYNFISLLDCDDYWLIDKLENQVPYLNKFDIIGTRAQYFGDRDDYPIVPVNDFINNHNLFVLNPVINSSVILHKSIAYWDETINNGLEDYDLWFKLWYSGKTFFNVDKVLCMHRIYSSSSFNNSNDNYVNELKQKWLKIIYKLE